jgi:ABC-2 type transport system permease protein
MHGGVAIGDVAWALVASAIINAVFAPIAMRMYYCER